MGARHFFIVSQLLLIRPHTLYATVGFVWSVAHFCSLDHTFGSIVDFVRTLIYILARTAHIIYMIFSLNTRLIL